ncbi:glycosyltransferase family 25 protein [uncultured Jannaschia sp.]|uniref:glycosyltransferase family 25 protein n=1 Tax=uncultured Jannaschia sp. TaxID=293347 RepID=UPI002603CA8C|nr:glycosyltransferase family 25 protein [uncultured Jannaschia sp.]
MKVEAALIVHLARATQRRSQVDRLIEDCPVPAEILDAVDGRALTPEALAARYVAGLHRPRYPFEANPGEIACFLSHRAAWTRIVEAGWDAALVIEDDAGIEAETLRRAIALAEAHPGEGFVQFQTRPPGPGETVASDGEIALIRPEVVPLRTTFNLFTRDAAMRLLEATERFDRPIDTTLQMHWITGVVPLVLWPSGATEQSEAVGGSVIQARVPGWAKMRREVMRPIYRAAIKRRSRKAP